MDNLNLSIIIPLYNAERYIQDCLLSLISQGINPARYEIIIIDDGSKDDSLRVVKEFSTNYFNIHIIHQENQGVGAARNKGIAQVRGAYIYFMDADDYLAQNTLCKVLDDALRRELDAVCFQGTDTNERNLFLSKNLDSYKMDDEIHTGIDSIANDSVRLAVWSFLVKKDFLLRNSLRFVEGIFYEDVIFALELFVAAERVSSTTLDVYRYYQHPTSITHIQEKVHFNKLIKYTKYVLIKINEIINKLSPESKNDKCIEVIKFWQHYFIFLLVAKLIVRSSIHFNAFNEHFNELISLKLYPITFYPGKRKVRLMFRLAVYCFNRPFLLFPFAYAVKRFNLGNYLQRSRKLNVR